MNWLDKALIYDIKILEDNAIGFCEYYNTKLVYFMPSLYHNKQSRLSTYEMTLFTDEFIKSKKYNNISIFCHKNMKQLDVSLNNDITGNNIYDLIDEFKKVLSTTKERIVLIHIFHDKNGTVLIYNK